MKRLLLICLFYLAIFPIASGQFPIPENTYRTNKNPHYWGNRSPYCGYWQQDVHYEIDARIDDTTNIIHGNFYRLTYWNNSPQELNELYFHLYQNAFQPESYYHKLNEANDIDVKFGPYEEKGLGTGISEMKVNGDSVNTLMDNTVLKVFLNKPLRPGDSLVVTCKFKTYFDKGTMRRRMSLFDVNGGKHYNGVHWYPTICVYDRKFTWHTDQHLDKEFYNNFGTFDVRLTLPQEYIVEATGTLVNQEEVMPDTLREKLDFKNFKEKPKDNKVSVIIPREYGKMKTWQYHAINVHNFAFTADPSYRIGEVNWNGVQCIALAQEQNAHAWQLSPWFTSQVIRIYSTDFGMYDWPKIIVADAKDGMEYPMITLDNGTYPGHQGLLAHEVGHMWFYGMVGSNETYRAFLDEGFTQFLTVWSMDRIVGELRQRKLGKKFFDKYLDSSWTRYERLYYPYINHVISGYDEQLNTHSTGFNGAIRHGGNYGLVYYKAGVMLYNLKYVLGDEVFIKAMQHYVSKWKFCHPYPEDFRDAITEYTQTDLNWFFDQWLESTKYIDYSIEKIEERKGLEKNNDTNRERTYDITFQRKGRMEMPVDFVVRTDKGNSYYYNIPNRWYSKQDSGVTVLPKWYGWDLLQPEYIAHVSVKPGEKILSVEIDPEHYLADIDLTNNIKGKGDLRSLQFEHHVPNATTWTKQRNYWRPDIWYNNYDGVQIGPHFQGSYMNKYSYSATGWFNTGLGQYRLDGEKESGFQRGAFDLYYERNTNRLWHYSKASGQFYYNAGIWKGELKFNKTFRKQDQQNPEYSNLYIRTKYLVNDESFREYLLFANQWGPDVILPESKNYINGIIDLGFSRHYTYPSGNGDFAVNVRTPSLGSDYNYGYLNLGSVNRINAGSFEIKSRLFGQAGLGNFPLESSLYLSGANPESFIENRITRAKAFFPVEWLGYGGTPNHFHYGGGLNLRGYAGYLAPESKTVNGTETAIFTYFGNSGAAYNLEIDFDKFFKIPSKGITKNLHLDTYLFADAGIIGRKIAGNTRFGKVRTDAGIGTALQIKFSPYTLKPVVVRFDMPLFLNTPPASEDYFQFRYIVGVNRAF